MSDNTPPEENAQANRRKACDLCFTKKIKCDMLKPVCSNCILYNTDCRTSIIRRKANPARVRAAPRPQQEENGRSEALEARLARIEEQLQLVLNAARDAAPRPQQSSHQQSPESHSTGSEATEGVFNAENEIYSGLAQSGSQSSSWKFDPVHPMIYEGPEPADSMALPPVEEVLPIVDHYFSTFNAVIPLFQQPAFMKILHAWYNQPNGRDRATWAAIQIVMALGYRTPQLALTDTQMVHVERADQCLRNAQTVVSELVTRDQDLLGVQILLGIVMLFQNSRDPKPASVIIGTAVRLAHRLQLHSNEAGEFFPAAEAEQRSRVFWIAYTLDKDICLRANTPSCQFDEDVDIALPTLAPTDSAGLIWTQNGQVHFNYHRRRVELAYIEGKVYDLLYSNRASKVRGQERQRRVVRLQAMLDQWYDRIPTVFHIDHVASTVGPSQLVQMTKMHHAFLLAEVMTHGIYSHNADWVKRISSFSRAAIGDLKIQGFSQYSCGPTEAQSPPLPEGWTKCVEVSRGCMRLFQNATPTECLVWQCSCSHFSALIILLSNMIIEPGHQAIHVDQHLAVKAIDLFDKLLGVIDDPQFRTLRAVVGELSQKAEEAVALHRRELARTGRDIFETLNVDNGTDAPPELDFLPPNTVFDGIDGPFAGLDASVDFDSSIFDQPVNDGLETLEDGGMLDLIGFMR
ncbi:transcriptional regulator [Fusarium albosuccineum]|uniref:Transcriptional regulator n=1 Tax=Fusarium albosuccineum TaxID=1237068 RepID=A0A8H4LNN4_9HYPO|nr:transcriptional regulator [Fusarium albosuccineum]